MGMAPANPLGSALAKRCGSARHVTCHAVRETAVAAGCVLTLSAFVREDSMDRIVSTSVARTIVPARDTVSRGGVSARSVTLAMLAKILSTRVQSSISKLSRIHQRVRHHPSMLSKSSPHCRKSLLPAALKTAADVEFVTSMAIANATLAIVDLHANLIVLMNAPTRATASRVLVCALLGSWALTVRSRVAAAAMVHARTLARVSATQGGQAETVLLC